VILKLETREALRNLPDILLEALRHDPVGLMIARGDLAVELSFERLAEMQEELLWFGEACHLPVVWATQVLDTLAHTGIPTRAEVTDAAMAMRAECVMLERLDRRRLGHALHWGERGRAPPVRGFLGRRPRKWERRL
jgi:pyruvate kinase